MATTGNRVALKDLVNRLSGYMCIWTGTLQANTKSVNLTEIKLIYDETNTNSSHLNNIGYTLLTLYNASNLPLGTLIGGPCMMRFDYVSGVVLPTFNDSNNSMIMVGCNCGHLQHTMKATLNFNTMFTTDCNIILQKHYMQNT